MAVKKRNSKKPAKRGTRKSTLKNKRKVKVRVSKFANIFMWGRRAAVLVAVLAVICWGGAWFFLSEADNDAAEWARSKSLEVTSDAGFRIKNIMVEGREHSDPDILLAVINVKKGDPMFSLDPNEAKAQIEKIGWIKSVRVERRLPDTIYIKLEERKPLVLWQQGKKLSLIDSDGEILERANLKKFKDLLMVRGEGAPARAENLMGLLDGEPALKSQVDHADLIDARRWDLYLSDGKRIKLPAADMGLALRSIMFRHEQEGILDMDFITVIDARYVGRLIVRTKLGKVQDYKAGMNNRAADL